MNCNDARRLMTEGFGDEATADQSVDLQRHLERCPDCAREQARWRALGQMLEAVPVPAVSVDLGRLHAEAARLRQRRLRRWRRVTAVCAATAAALLLVAIKLEVRFERAAVAVRWGEPVTQIVERSRPVTPPLVELNAGTQAVTADDMQLVKDLIRALAGRVETLDRRDQQTLALLEARLELLRRQVQPPARAGSQETAAYYQSSYRDEEKGE